MSIENGARKGKRLYYDIDIINKIIDILDMRDKFGKSDTYIRFLVEDGNAQLKEYRKKNNLSVNLYDYVIKNDNLEKSVQIILTIIQNEYKLKNKN